MGRTPVLTWGDSRRVTTESPPGPALHHHRHRRILLEDVGEPDVPAQRQHRAVTRLVRDRPLGAAPAGGGCDELDSPGCAADGVILLTPCRTTSSALTALYAPCTRAPSTPRRCIPSYPASRVGSCTFICMSAFCTCWTCDEANSTIRSRWRRWARSGPPARAVGSRSDPRTHGGRVRKISVRVSHDPGSRWAPPAGIGMRCEQRSDTATPASFALLHDFATRSKAGRTPSSNGARRGHGLCTGG